MALERRNVVVRSRASREGGSTIRGYAVTATRRTDTDRVADWLGHHPDTVWRATTCAYVGHRRFRLRRTTLTGSVLMSSAKKTVGAHAILKVR